MPWQGPQPQRRPFDAEERRLIREAIARGRVQRITSGGWSAGQFYADAVRDLIHRQFVVIRTGRGRRR